MIRRTYSSIRCILMLPMTAAPSFAQGMGSEAVEKSYVLSYFIVGLGVALGIVAICSGSKRSAEVRRPE